MDKILLIINREYTSRVFKKSFLLITLITPLAIGLVMFGAGYLTANSMETQKKVAIKDEANVFIIDSLSSESFTYTKTTEPIESLKKNYIKNGYDLLIHSSPIKDTTSTKLDVQYFSKEKLSITQIQKLEREFERQYEEYKLSHSSIDRKILDQLDANVSLENGMLNEKDNADGEGAVGDKSSKFSSGIATGLAYGMGFLMYMVIFIFGSMVMRSVMEEKINRIVEVMISSVKPFQLMMGKVIGVGLVGITQLLVWIVLMAIIIPLVAKFMSPEAAVGMSPSGQQAMDAMKQIENQPNGMLTFINELKALNWLFIVPIFIIYFFAGYFIYSTLFAAVGSAASDDMADSQQLMMPITVIIIMAFAMIGSVITNPNGPVAIFGSMFPLLSPILMPARLPFDPPMWQVGLSMLFLILGILFFTWMAGRIYRVGILMYGKKVGFKELSKWIFTKE
jgi:ABC-2 type transport system permease protein